MGNAPGRERISRVSSPSSASSPAVLTRLASAESAITFSRRVSEPEDEPLTLPPARSRHDSDECSGPPLPARCVPLVVELSTPLSTGSVGVAGTFTNWRLHLLPLSEREQCSLTFLDIFNVSLGRHEYRFLVDGQWQVDERVPSCLSTSEEYAGVWVNYRQVCSEDVAECESLENFASVSNPGHDANLARGSSSTPPGSYTSILPPRSYPSSQRPPALPPHLLQVLLNKDTPLSCEPTLLPAPNHVMLNHLYALSIRHGVVVLSGTHRYRKKYVTTLLYKPI